MQGQKKRNAIIGYFQKRDSLTFLGDLDNLDARSTARRNSKEGTDLLSVLANPVNIRKTSAPPLNRQISLSSMKVLITAPMLSCGVERKMQLVENSSAPKS